MKVLAAHQPQYLPWIGYFNKLDLADVFVLLDDVQFKKNEWQNRNRIRTAEGWQWLTVPVRHRFPQLIREVEIDRRQRWAAKHLEALRTNYGPAPHFREYMPLLEEVLGRPWTHLSPLNIELVRRLALALGIGTPILCSSDLAVDGDATGRLVNLCLRLEADIYLSGPGGRAYLDASAFERAGLTLRFQEFRHPVYRQLHGSFVPNLSVVDLLFNCGQRSLAIVRGPRAAGEPEAAAGAEADLASRQPGR